MLIWGYFFTSGSAAPAIALKIFDVMMSYPAPILCIVYTYGGVNYVMLFFFNLRQPPTSGSYGSAFIPKAFQHIQVNCVYSQIILSLVCGCLNMNKERAL